MTPLFGSITPLRIPTKTRFISNDSNVVSYILAVEAADGQQLESGVITAVENFVLGCKSDGIWSAIKASCILAGARTLTGSLVPLVGAAPTNTNNNFVSGDYNRKTGLIGNQSTKYLNTNQPENTASDSNDIHIAINATTAEASANLAYIGVNDTSVSPTANTSIVTNIRFTNRGDISPSTFARNAGFHGTSRSGSTINFRSAGSTESTTSPPNNSTSLPFYVFARNSNGTANIFCDPRLSFYSIGESIDLALLDTRVSTLMTDLAAAIP